jgi:hypothetical protein
VPRALLVVVPVLAALGMSAAGCFTPAQRRQETLTRVVREYNDGLRWRRYEQVTPHLSAGEAERFLARTGKLGDDVEMADQEVTSIRFADDQRRAAVTVELTWYEVRRALVRRTVVEQDWRFEDGRWICATQRRVRGEPFPLFPDSPPAAPAAPTAP